MNRSVSASASEMYARERTGQYQQNPHFSPYGPKSGPSLCVNLKVNVEFAQAMRSLRLVDDIAAASATNELAGAYDYPSQRPSTEQPPTERIGYRPQQTLQLQGPPGASQQEQLGIPMPDQDLLMMMRAPPQMSRPMNPMNPMNMGLGQPPLGNKYQLGAYPSHPQGHANRIVGWLQQVRHSFNQYRFHSVIESNQDQRKNSISKEATPHDQQHTPQSSTDPKGLVKSRSPTSNATLSSTTPL